MLTGWHLKNGKTNGMNCLILNKNRCMNEWKTCGVLSMCTYVFCPLSRWCVHNFRVLINLKIFWSFSFDLMSLKISRWHCSMCSNANGPKGQLISEWKYEVVTLPKIWMKKFEKFCPKYSGQNFSNFSSIFWAMWRLYTFILKFTDL